MRNIRVSIRQFADVVGVSHTRVRQLVQSGVLPKPNRWGLPYSESMEAWRSYSAGRTTWKQHGRKQTDGTVDLSAISTELDNELIAIQADLEAGLEETISMLEEVQNVELDCIELESLDIDLADIQIRLDELET